MRVVRIWADYVTGYRQQRRTKKFLLATQNTIKDYLKFTAEGLRDFEGGWLPTLDTSLKVLGDNTTIFKYYEKEHSSKKILQQKTALEENSKQKIISNDFIRRLVNTLEGQDKEVMVDIADRYAQKLINSGYSHEQARKTIVNGIRWFASRKKRCLKEGRTLRRTGLESRSTRTRNRSLAKTSWFKKKPKEDLYEKKAGGRVKNIAMKTPSNTNKKKKKNRRRRGLLNHHYNL